MPHYQIDLHNPARHVLSVRIQMQTLPDQPSVDLFLPNWIVGSYLVRDFARHLNGLHCVVAGTDTPAGQLQQISKSHWQLTVTPEYSGRDIELRYEVYAFDESVRTAYWADDRLFFNGTSVCLRVQGQEQQAHSISLHGLPAHWSVATGLDTLPPLADGSPSYGAPNYSTLIDCPVQAAQHWLGHFTIRGAKHVLAVSGAWADFDGSRLLRDTEAICHSQIDFWHAQDQAPVMSRYVFLLHASAQAYGGLEHYNSTALLCSRSDLPTINEEQSPEGYAKRDAYVQLLGLISHEYFHTWNVKRLKPLDLLHINDQQENYTRLLWFFEGLTSYYDDQFLLRSGRIGPEQYRQLLAKSLHSVLSTPGRLCHSVADASFDAWVRYYRPDEFSVNASVSYYAQGAWVGLCLDALLRRHAQAPSTQGLDDLMRWLWHQGGLHPEFDGLSRPITDQDIDAGIAQLCNGTEPALYRDWIDGRSALPVAQALLALGWQCQPELPDDLLQWGSLAQRWQNVSKNEDPRTALQPWCNPAALGLKLKIQTQKLVITGVLDGGAAQEAGLSVHDEIIALNGVRIHQNEDIASVLLRHAISCASDQAVEPCRWTVCRQARVFEISMDLTQGLAFPPPFSISEIRPQATAPNP